MWCQNIAKGTTDPRVEFVSTKQQLQNLSYAAFFFIIEDNLFTTLSSYCDIMKQLASLKAIKFAKQKLVTDNGRQWLTRVQ